MCVRTRRLNFGFLKLDSNRLWILGENSYWWGPEVSNQFPSTYKTVLFDGRDLSWGPGPNLTKSLSEPRAVHVGENKYLVLAGRTWNSGPRSKFATFQSKMVFCLLPVSNSSLD